MNQVAPRNPLANLEEAHRLLARAVRADESKRVADVAEAMRVYARQAKLGLEAENQAAELKVRAQRRTGELLAETERHQGGRPSETSRQQREVLTVPELGLTHDEASKFQQLADLPEPVFEEYVQTAKEQGERITSAGARMAVHYSSATPEWETPQDLFDRLASEFDFALDVCATAENRKCHSFYSKAEDGLAQPWTGICWMNPPYGVEIRRWVEKAYQAGQGGATVVCLLPARTDTGWWWDFCTLAEIRFLRGRLKFGGATTGAPFPNAIVIFGRPQNSPEGMWWGQ